GRWTRFWPCEFLRRQNSAGVRCYSGIDRVRIENKRCRCCDYGRGEPGPANARGENAGRSSAARAKTRQARFRNCWASERRSTSTGDFRWRLRERAGRNERKGKHGARHRAAAGERARVGEEIVRSL